MQAHGFRVYFTPLSEVLFTFPSRYSSAIGLSVVFSLSGWSPTIQPGFLVSRPTQVPASLLQLRVRGSHPLRRGVPSASASPQLRSRRSYNPGTGLTTAPVWALPVPLAATPGIVITFSSCAYLDVSVQRVRLRLRRMTGSLPPGCPIRTSADLRAFAPPRGFSQLVTSFLASESPGIPHAPLFVPLYLHYNVTTAPLHRLLAAPRATTVLALPLTFDLARCSLAAGARCVYSVSARDSAPLLSASFRKPRVRRASRLQHVNVLVPFALLLKFPSSGKVLSAVVLGRVELPTSTLSV